MLDGCDVRGRNEGKGRAHGTVLAEDGGVGEGLVDGSQHLLHVSSTFVEVAVTSMERIANVDMEGQKGWRQDRVEVLLRRTGRRAGKDEGGTQTQGWIAYQRVEVGTMGLRPRETSFPPWEKPAITVDG